MINPRKIATLGIGFGALAVATFGFFGDVLPAEQTDFTSAQYVAPLKTRAIKGHAHSVEAESSVASAVVVTSAKCRTQEREASGAAALHIDGASVVESERESHEADAIALEIAFVFALESETATGEGRQTWDKRRLAALNSVWL